jgi:hypothetical protein
VGKGCNAAGLRMQERMEIRSNLRRFVEVCEVWGQGEGCNATGLRMSVIQSVRCLPVADRYDC